MSMCAKGRADLWNLNVSKYLQPWKSTIFKNSNLSLISAYKAIFNLLTTVGT